MTHGDVISYYPDGSWNLDVLETWPIDAMHEIAKGMRGPAKKTIEIRLRPRPFWMAYLEGARDLKVERLEVAGCPAILRSYWRLPA